MSAERLKYTAKAMESTINGESVASSSNIHVQSHESDSTVEQNDGVASGVGRIDESTFCKTRKTETKLKVSSSTDHLDSDGLKLKPMLRVYRRKPKTYLCTVCGRGFADSGNLAQHMRIHTGEKPFACVFCCKRFAQRSNMKSHEQIHLGKQFQCRYCPKRFAKASNLNSHEVRHTGEGDYVCEHCGKVFFHNYELIRHKIVHAGIKPFKCSQCNKAFAQKSNLTVHYTTHSRIVQTTEGPHTCKVCKKTFKSHAELENHKPIHAKGTKLFECAKCRNNFDTAIILKFHMRTHVDKKNFRCRVCRKSYLLRSLLWNHMHSHHSTKCPFRCPNIDCGKAFKMKVHLTQHMVVHSGIKGFKNDICIKKSVHKSNHGRGISYKSKRLVHANVTQQEKLPKPRPYKCQFDGCHRTYKHATNLLFHQNQDHNKEHLVEQYRCKDCGSKFKQEHRYKKHKCKSQKTKPKPFGCNICPKTFRKSHQLQKHKQQHTKMYKCALCSSTFVTDLLRKKHVETHTQYFCSTCGERFKTEADYSEHMKIHAAQAEMHKCRTCGQVFLGASKLKMHEIRMHGLSPFRCRLCTEGFQRASQLKEHELKHLKDTPH